MKRAIWLLALGVLAVWPGVAAAEEVGRVISSAPVIQQVAVPRQVCTAQPGTDNAQQCSVQTTQENRTVGYNVVYEYAGKQHSAQLPYDPGPTIRLRLTPVGPAGLPPPIQGADNTVWTPQAVILSPQPIVHEQIVAYPTYYSRPYYQPYYAPYYAPIGVSLGFGFSSGHRFHHHRHRHWR